MKDNNINTFGKGISFPDFIERPCTKCGELTRAYLTDFNFKSLHFSVKYSPPHQEDISNSYDPKILCRKCYKTDKLIR